MLLFFLFCFCVFWLKIATNIIYLSFNPIFFKVIFGKYIDYKCVCFFYCKRIELSVINWNWSNRSKIALCARVDLSYSRKCKIIEIASTHRNDGGKKSNNLDKIKWSDHLSLRCDAFQFNYLFSLVIFFFICFICARFYCTYQI